MHKKIVALITAIIIIFCIPLFAGKNSLQIQKEEIIDIIKLFKAEKDEYEASKEPIRKIKIGKPIHNKSQKTAKPKNTKPIIHDFTHKTVWGKFKATVIEYPQKNYFKVSFESKYPVQKIELMDTTTKNKIYVKSLNDIKKFSDKVNFAFKPIYVLILSANINDQIQPNIIPLYKKANIKYK